MNLELVLDRIEDDQAVLFSEEIGVEITIPYSSIEGKLKIGDKCDVTILGLRSV